jgi:hypothetical protein
MEPKVQPMFRFLATRRVSRVTRAGFSMGGGVLDTPKEDGAGSSLARVSRTAISIVDG